MWIIRLDPGERVPFHIHELDYGWTALSNGTGRSYFNDNTMKEKHYKIGNTKFYDNLNKGNYFIHDL